MTAAGPASARRAVARTISLIGHPIPITSACGLGALAVRGQDPAVLHTAMAAVAGLAAILLGWSGWQVRRGRWGHVDAIDPRERCQLNHVAVLLIGGGAAAAWAAGMIALGVGLGCAALILSLAIAASPWLKLSQHVAFALLAAALAGLAAPLAGAAVALLAIAIGWSRRMLGRHTPAEIAAGAAAGVLAGVILTTAARLLG